MHEIEGRGNVQFTPPIAKIICVKNSSAWVSMVSYLKNLKRKYAENRIKIVGAVWQLLANPA